MPLTPIDIQNKEFSRAIRGLAAHEVEEFLVRVAKEFEDLIKENLAAKEQISQLKERLSHYQKLEHTLHNAIVVAQETAEEVEMLQGSRFNAAGSRKRLPVSWMKRAIRPVGYFRT